MVARAQLELDPCAQAHAAILECLREELATCQRRLALYNRVITPLEKQLEEVDVTTKPGRRLATQIEIRLEMLDGHQKKAARHVAHLTAAVDDAVEDRHLLEWVARRDAERNAAAAPQQELIAVGA